MKITSIKSVFSVYLSIIFKFNKFSTNDSMYSTIIYFARFSIFQAEIMRVFFKQK